MEPLHTLHTPRLTLTLFNPADPADISALIALFNDPVALERQGDYNLHTPADILALTAPCVVPSTRFSKAQPPANLTPDLLPKPTDAEPATGNANANGSDGRATTYTLPAFMIRPSNDPSSPRIGSISLVQRGRAVIPDMGWAVLQEHAGKGYATEAAREALRYWTQDLGLSEMMVTTNEANRGSWRIAEKLGLVKVGKGVRDEKGDLRTLYILEGMEEPEDGMVFRFHGDGEGK